MAANVFESWPLDEVRGFECAHEESWTWVMRGRADAVELGEHLRKIPEPLVAPSSLVTADVHRCEQIDLMIAEAASFWETQLYIE